MRYFLSWLAVVLTAGLGFAANYTTTGYGGRLADSATWVNGSMPSPTDATAVWRLAAYGNGPVSYTNDWNVVPSVKQLLFTGDKTLAPDPQSCRLAGGRWTLSTSSGLTLDDSLPAGSVVTVASDLTAAASDVNLSVPLGRTLLLEGNLTESGTQNHYFDFCGYGTNVIRGSYVSATAHSGGGSYPFFSTGTTVIEGNVTVTKLGIANGAYVEIRPGGILRATGSTSQIKVATIDVNGGTLEFDNTADFGYAAGKTTIIVRNGGIFDPTTSGGGFGRSTGNLTDIRILDGGTMYMRAPAYRSWSSYGTTQMTIDGGTVIEGAYSIFLGSEYNANATNSITLKSGTLIGQELSSNAGQGSSTSPRAGAGNHGYVYCDGGTLQATKNTTKFVTPLPEKVHTVFRAGGLVFNTRSYNVTYNGVIADTDQSDGRTGPLVKMGSGTLTLSGDDTYTSSNIVFSGTLAIANTNRASLCVVKPGATLTINDPTYYTNAVALETTGRLSFPGTSNTLHLATLTSQGGEIVLNKGQTIALDACPAATGMVGFRIPYPDTANMTYNLLSCPTVDAAFVSKCRVVNPYFDRDYEFSVKSGVLQLTVKYGSYSWWAGTATANWSASTSWTGGYVPNAATSGAIFYRAATANISVNLDMNATVGKIRMSHTNTYDIADAGGTLTMNRTGGAVAFITADSTAQKISAPLHLAVPTYLTVSSTFYFNGTVTGEDGAYLVIKGGTVYIGGTVSVPVYVLDSATVYLTAGAKLLGGVTVSVGSVLQANGDCEIGGTLVAPEGAKIRTSNGATILLKNPPKFLDALHGAGDRLSYAVESFDGFEKARTYYASIAYAGKDDAVCETAVNNSTGSGSVLKIASGGGNLTFAGTVNPYAAGSSSWGYFNFIGDTVSTLTVDTALKDSCDFLTAFRFGGGRVRFGPHFGFAGASDKAGAFRIGGDSGCPTYATMAAGANVSGYDIQLAPEANATGADVSFVQEGGTIRARGALVFGAKASGCANTYTMTGGTYENTASSDWNRFLYGDSTLVVSNGATMALRSVTFGSETNVSVSYARSNVAASTDVRVAGGALGVTTALDLSADTDTSRNNRIVSGAGADGAVGLLTLPAAVRTQAGDGLFAGGAYTSVGVDGGALALSGVLSTTQAGATGNLADYFPGLGAFLVGAGGGIVDTGANDITISAPAVASSADGVLVKTGTGRLSFAGTNTVFGGVDVRAGTLAMKFNGEKVRSLGDGLVAYWDFDGENPYADKSGNGHDLSPYIRNASGAVTFVSDDALDGKSAKWTTTAGLAAFTNAETEASLPVNESTVILFLRLASWDPIHADDTDHRTIFSTAIFRSGTSETYSSSSFDLYSPAANKLNAVASAISQYDASSTLSLNEWHSVAVVRRATSVRLYIDGILVTTSTSASATLQFLSNTTDRKYLFTLGRGAHGRYCGLQGMMIDDVAIYRRPLTAAEVKAYHESRGAKPTTPVAVAADATLDLAGGPLATSCLAGGGAVTNGLLTVDGTLVADGVSPVYVKDLAFAANGTIDFGREVGDRLKTRVPVTVATFDTLDAASEANLKTWKAVNVGRPAGQNYRTEVTVDRAAKAVRVRIHSGLAIFLK